MMAKWLALGVLMLMAGCQTMTPEERRAADRETCRAYGFKRNNDALATCMMRLDLERRQVVRDNRIYLNEWERDFWYRRHRPYW